MGRNEYSAPREPAEILRDLLRGIGVTRVLPIPDDLTGGRTAWFFIAPVSEAVLRELEQFKEADAAPGAAMAERRIPGLWSGSPWHR